MFLPPGKLPVKLAFFLKSRLLFNIFYCFCMFVNKHFANSTIKDKKVKFSLYYFYMNMNM